MNRPKLKVLLAAGVLLVLQLVFISYAVEDIDLFRSQNALYHSRLASLYSEGVSVQELGILSHSEMHGNFVDQHWLFHHALGIAQRIFSPAVALLGLSVLGLLALNLLMFRALSGTPFLFRFLLPLSLPWILTTPYTRWLSTRPGIWSAFLFIFAILELRKKRCRLRDIDKIAAVALIWSAFSLLAWILLPIIVLFFVFQDDLHKAWRRLGIDLLIVAGALLTGSVLAQGLDFFWFAGRQIMEHPLGHSGVYEWGPPNQSLIANLFPVLVHLLLLFAIVRKSAKNPALAATAFQNWGALLFLGLGLSVLSVMQQRWLDFAWPLTLLNLGFIFSDASVVKLRTEDRRRTWIASALGAALMIALVFFPNGKRPQADGTFNPRLLAFLNDVHRKFPGSPAILTLDFTAWSTDFYLNPHTKMEPGFSLGLYGGATGFARDFRNLRDTPRSQRLEEYTKLLNDLGTDLVIAREDQLGLDDNQDWFESLYRSGGWVYARIHKVMQPLPIQKTGSFNGREPVFALCQQNVFAIKTDGEPPAFPKDKAECEEALNNLARAANPNEDAEILKIYFQPQKLRTFRQVESATNRGFFAYYDPAAKQFFDTAPAGAKPEDLQAVPVIHATLGRADFQLRGRRLAFPDPRKSQICDAYQSLATQMVKHSPDTFKIWTEDSGASDALRSRMSLGILCSRSQLIPLKDKAHFTDVCLEFKSRLEKDAKQLKDDVDNHRPGNWSERLLIDILALQHGLESPLKDLSRFDILKRGRVVTHAVNVNGKTENIRHRQTEVFTSGHYALWWTVRWQKLRDQGFIPSAQEHDDFENFAGLYEKTWRKDFEYNTFAIRWWSEALVNSFARSPSPQTSHWMEQFFRAASTFTKGSTDEDAPECLGPYPPGIGPMPYPDHNAGLLLEALEQARRVNFDWWSETEEQMLRNLLSCTLSMQKSKIFWPANQVGEIAWTTGDGTYRADTQAHALNALGLRIENDQITCPQ